VASAAAVAFLALHVRLENRFFDLMVYRSAVRWWVDGNPLYDYSQPDPYQESLGFTYPPVGAFLLRPLAYLDRSAAIWAYGIVAVACVAASVWWLTGAVARRHGWSRPALFGVALVVTASLGAVWIGFDFGQINPILWALIVFDLAVLAPRRSRFLGIGIGLATAIKLIPGIFIVYLLVTRRPRGVIVASATAGLVTLIAHVAAPSDSIRYWTSVVWGGEGVGHLYFFMNQSISGVLARIYQPDAYPTALWLGLCLPVFLYGMWRARRAALSGDELTGIALTGFVGSLISPVTWTHHIFWWVPALLAIADTALAPAPRSIRPGLAGGVSNRVALLLIAALTYPIVVLNAVAHPQTGFVNLVMANWIVWLMLLLVATLPIDPDRSLTAPSTRDVRAT
jgi:alpha-1,2-mannosyltransferase